MPESGDSLRARLDSIVETTASSGVRTPTPTQSRSRIRKLSLAMFVVCLPLGLLIIVRVHQHNERLAWVNAVKQVGLKARLEQDVFGGKVPRLIPRWIHDLWAEEKAIVEIDSDANVALLLSSEANATTKVHVRTYIRLVPAQRVRIWSRFRRCEIEEWGRGP